MYVSPWTSYCVFMQQHLMKTYSVPRLLWFSYLTVASVIIATGGAPGTKWVGARGAAPHPTVPRLGPQGACPALVSQCLARETLPYGTCPPLGAGAILTLSLWSSFISFLTLCWTLKGFVRFGLALASPVIIFIQPLLWRHSLSWCRK